MNAQPLTTGSKLFVRYLGYDTWHERYVLLEAGSGGRKYVILTPDQDIYLEDFSTNNTDIDGLRLAPPGGGIPRGLPPADVYRFRAYPSRDELRDLMVEAQAEVDAEFFREGGGRPGSVWISLENVHTIKRGDVVTLTHMAEVIGDRAVDSIDVLGQNKRFCCAQVDPDKVDEFKRDLGVEGGDDARILTIGLRAGVRHRDFAHAVEAMSLTNFTDWRCVGPRTAQWCVEFLARRGGPMAHHEWWRHSTGLALNDIGVAEHECVMKAVEVAAEFDQVDIFNLCSFEHILRKAQLWEHYHRERTRREQMNTRDKDKNVIDMEEQQISLGTHTSDGALMVCPDLIQWVAKELERISAVDKNARKAREERALRKV